MPSASTLLDIHVDALPRDLTVAESKIRLKRPWQFFWKSRHEESCKASQERWTNGGAVSQELEMGDQKRIKLDKVNIRWSLLAILDAVLTTAGLPQMPSTFLWEYGGDYIITLRRKPPPFYVATVMHN
jgi:hypothetical protein